MNCTWIEKHAIKNEQVYNEIVIFRWMEKNKIKTSIFCEMNHFEKIGHLKRPCMGLKINA